jgi:hypothetical protein
MNHILLTACASMAAAISCPGVAQPPKPQLGTHFDGQLQRKCGQAGYGTPSKKRAFKSSNRKK